MRKVPVSGSHRASPHMRSLPDPPPLLASIGQPVGAANADPVPEVSDPIKATLHEALRSQAQVRNQALRELGNAWGLYAVTKPGMRREIVGGANCAVWRNNEMDLHATDHPALIHPNGERLEWRQNGKLHRDDGPAMVFDDGELLWYHQDRLHRFDRPAVVSNRKVEWHTYGVLHRLDGPAEISQGTMSWHIHGHLHREDGPAVMSSTLGVRWFLKGQKVSPGEVMRDWDEETFMRSALSPFEQERHDVASFEGCPPHIRAFAALST